MSDPAAAIAALEAKLRQAPSAASRFGIEKQIKAQRAKGLRETRKEEQRRREAGLPPLGVEQGAGRVVAVWMIMWASVILIFASHSWTTLKGTFFQDK